MRKLVLAAAITSLIAIPSAFAHGKSTGHHGRAHANARHASYRANRHSKAVDGVVSTDQANQSRSARSSSRHPDEEEVEVDELASKAN
jgi:hypothetical protein